VLASDQGWIEYLLRQGVSHLDLALQESKIFLQRNLPLQGTSASAKPPRHTSTPHSFRYLVIHAERHCRSAALSVNTSFTGLIAPWKPDSFQLADNTPRIPDIFPVATRALMTALLALIG